MLDRIDVQNDPVNFVDPDGLIAGVDDVTVIAAIALTAATTAYLNSPEGQKALNQISNDLGCIGAKMAAEISRIKEKLSGPQGIQYSLRVSGDGWYPDARGGTQWLNQGDVWKYGETTNPNNRYSQTELSKKNLAFVPESTGNQVEIKIAEKTKIYGYFLSRGHLPPGNKNFR